MSIILSKEEKAHLKYLSEILTPLEKQIFRAKVLGLKQKEIAFILGISQQAVSRWLKKIEIKVSKGGSNSAYI